MMDDAWMSDDKEFLKPFSKTVSLYWFLKDSTVNSGKLSR